MQVLWGNVGDWWVGERWIEERGDGEGVRRGRWLEGKRSQVGGCLGGDAGCQEGFHCCSKGCYGAGC